MTCVLPEHYVVVVFSRSLPGCNSGISHNATSASETQNNSLCSGPCASVQRVRSSLSTNMSFLFGPWYQDRTPQVRYPPAPALIQTNGVLGKEFISLQELVENRCPSLLSKFHPAWWLPRSSTLTFGSKMKLIFHQWPHADPLFHRRRFFTDRQGEIQKVRTAIYIQFTPQPV